MIPLLLPFVGLLAVGMPVAFVVGISAFAYFHSVPYLNFQVAVQMIFSQSQSFPFLAVPFFIFAGNLMNVSGITTRILELARLLTRTMYGGTAQLSVFMSTLMGGISGSATADAAMNTRILGPDMMRLGYPKGYICALQCVTAMVVATLPPSLGLIIFGFVGEVSIARLFAAGIVPGFMIAIALMITAGITTRVRGFEPPAKDTPRLTFGELFSNLKTSIWALLFPVILIVGIRFGVFTPSESGAFAVLYAVLIGKFVYKELTWEKFKGALGTTLKDNGAIMLIIAMSGPFSFAVTWLQLPVTLSGFIFGITENPQGMVLIMLGFLFVVGLFVDSNVNFLLLTPIFLPMVTAAGIDPVHFGILMATIATLGVMTPPVGTALLTVCGIINCPIDEYTKESLPFMLTIFVVLIILLFFPNLVLFIPDIIFG
ncbi:MAG: TRAP transporter large permease [Spirochaetes bacterium]|nr:TRAP transporter large permease [Spirochaetota bacterium]